MKIFFKKLVYFEVNQGFSLLYDMVFIWFIVCFWGFNVPPLILLKHRKDISKSEITPSCSREGKSWRLSIFTSVVQLCHTLLPLNHLKPTGRFSSARRASPSMNTWLGKNKKFSQVTCESEVLDIKAPCRGQRVQNHNVNRGWYWPVDGKLHWDAL